MLIMPDVYDELVQARRRIGRLESDNIALHAELRDEREARNKAVDEAGRAFLIRDREYLTIKCMLDPVVLRHAYSTREAFNHILMRWFEELWAAYRDTEIPKRVASMDEADPTLV